MPNILSRAELLLQAKNYSGTGAWLDESGNSHDAQLGSTAGVDANDPEFLAHSGDNYVRLPGSSGNYVSSADVNLLDADTAHCYQSYGLWAATNTGDTTLEIADAPSGYPFADKALKTTNGITAAQTLWLGNPATSRPAISASTEYSYTVWVYNETDATTMNLDIRYGDSGGSTISTVAGTDDFAVPVGVWTELSVTLTSPGTAAHVSILVRVNEDGAPAANEVTWIGAACIRAGSDGTFVPSLRIVGDLDLRVKASRDDWTSTTDQWLIGTYPNTTKPWGIRLFTNDTMYGYIYDTGGTPGIRTHTWDTTTNLGLVDGQATEFRYTVELGGNYTLYLDGVQYESVASGVTGPLLDTWEGFGYLPVGGPTNVFDGNIYWAEVRDGIDGPVVARYDADDASEPFATQTGATDGRTWTYNRSGAGLYVVDRPAFGLHTDDYMIVADDAGLDFANADSFTALAVIRIAADTQYMRIISKRDGLTGYEMHYSAYLGDQQAIGGFYGDGTNIAADAGSAADSIAVRTAAVGDMRLNAPSDTLEFGVDGAFGVADDISGVSGTMANAATLNLGASVAPDGFFDGEIMAVALFREALTDDEVALVGKSLAGLAPGSGEYVDQDALGAIRNRLLFEGTYTEATAPRGIVGALNAFLGTTAGDVEGALNEKIGSGYVGIVQACNTLLAGNATVYEVNDGLRKLAELYVP